MISSDRSLPMGRVRRRGLILAALSLANAAQATEPPPKPSPPVLPVEDSDTAVLGPTGPHRFFLFDPYGYSSTTVVEGDDDQLKTLGTVPSARNGAFAITRDASKIVVAETYWTRGNRGDRQDLLSIYDGQTLELEKEIPLPGRLIIVPKSQQVSLSNDEKLAYVYDMIPSTALHIVDLLSGKTINSVDVPGCAYAYPFGPRSFATICGDGTIGTTTLDGEGKGKLTFSKPFFNPDQDPVFENSIVDRDSGHGWFLSFAGKVYEANLASGLGIAKPWSLTEAAGLPLAGTGVQELAWRPGGAQIMALHRATRTLYVLMHPGTYWTHKAEGTEIWVLNADKHSLIRRIKLDSSASSVSVTQDTKPLLYAFASRKEAKLSVYDPATGKKLREAERSGVIGTVPGL